MTKSIIQRASFLITALAIIAVAIWALYPKNPEDGVRNSYSPNILIGDELYWYVTTYASSDMPDGLASIGSVSKNISGISTENFLETGAASGVGVGAEVYQSKTRPGQIYVIWEENLNLFTIELLSFPLVRYDGALYINLQQFQDSGFSDSFAPISPTHFSEDFSCVGSLTTAEVGCTVPMDNLESNYSFYVGSNIYFNPEDTSTIYVDTNNKRQDLIAFYDVSLIPLDFSPYELRMS